jgi:hypothetical protein
MRNGVIGLLTLLVAATGCGPKHRLREFQFAGKTLAFVYIAPPAPILRTGTVDLDSVDNAVSAVLKAGTTAAKEREARKARFKLDSALRRVDFSARLAQQSLERVSRYLGTSAVSGSADADYILEVQMQKLGIDVSGDAAAYLFTNAETVLLDRRTGAEIWSVNVTGTDRLTPAIQGVEGVPGGIVAASTLNRVSVADFQHALEQLATLSSNVIAEEMREALRDARKK